jgi:hypothetical protein
MKTLTLIALLAASLVPRTGSTQANDFMAGRLFQIALENAESFTATGTPSFGTLVTGASQTFHQTLAAGTCYMWIAAGDTGLSDLDLAVDVGGVQVGGDNQLDDWPVARYCSAAAAEIRIELLMYTGAGSYGFNTYSRYFGGADQIELNLNFYASVFAAGSIPQGPPTRVTSTTGEEHTFPLTLSAGRCYTIVGASGTGVSDVDFFLQDPAGLVVDTDEAPDTYPVVGVCPNANGTYTLRTLLYSGAGEFGWQLFQQDRF